MPEKPYYVGHKRLLIGIQTLLSTISLIPGEMALHLMPLSIATGNLFYIILLNVKQLKLYIYIYIYHLSLIFKYMFVGQISSTGKRLSVNKFGNELTQYSTSWKRSMELRDFLTPKVRWNNNKAINYSVSRRQNIN